ncbi:MAG: hypothetical protein RRY23_00190 [Alistipes sp.]
MTTTEVLAAVTQVLLNARLKLKTDTEANWTKNNPVLLDGEVGLVSKTYPLKFKVGDGTTGWTALGWGNVAMLTQLMDDATHRLVSDVQITAWNAKAPATPATGSAAGLMSGVDKAKLDGIATMANYYIHPNDANTRHATDAQMAAWNAKARRFIFDHSAYQNSDPSTSNPQKQIAKDLVAVANAGENIIVFASDVLPPETTYRDRVAGIVSIGSITTAEVIGTVNDFVYDSNDEGQTITLISAEITFKADGTVIVTKTNLTPLMVTKEGITNLIAKAFEDFTSNSFIISCGTSIIQ